MFRPRLRDPKLEQSWRSRLSRWTASGLTVRDFCRRHHLAERAFYFWRQVIVNRSKGRSSRRRLLTFRGRGDGGRMRQVVLGTAIPQLHGRPAPVPQPRPAPAVHTPLRTGVRAIRADPTSRPVRVERYTAPERSDAPHERHPWHTVADIPPTTDWPRSWRPGSRSAPRPRPPG